MSVVVSNHGPDLPRLVEELGLAVDAVVTSAAVGVEKPNPRIFRIALDHAGNPDRVWMIGDNPVADIGGGAAAGIPRILVDDTTGPLMPPTASSPISAVGRQNASPAGAAPAVRRT